MRSIEVILKEKIAQFSDQIKKLADMSQAHHLSNKAGGFPIFFENQTYNEQSFFEERIENAIWKILVNNILKDLFCDEYCTKKGVIVQWKRMYPPITYSYVEKTEEKYPLEFVIVYGGTRTGYRYTNCYWFEEQMEAVFKNNSLDELRILDFSSNKTSSFMHPLMVSPKYRSLVTKVTLRDFFVEFFSEEEYDTYLSSVQAAVFEAYKYVGLQSVSNLTLQHLPYFIKGIFKDLSVSKLSSKTYSIFKPDRLKKEFKKILADSNNHFTAEDYKELDRLFYGEKRYLALCGKEAFAHSFITSEYLYQTLRINNVFDYTAIVSGYLKSVEQLLFRIESYLLNNLPSEQLWIKSSRSDMKKKPDEFVDNWKGRSKRHVKFTPDNQKYFDTTFTPLVNLIGDYERGWNISEGGRNLVTTYLQVYCSECRNEHFHKDNINNLREVDIIRDNTILLFYYVLGGFNFYGNKEKDYQVLGIVDRSFEDMYHAIMKQSNGGDYFLITFTDGLLCLAALPMNHGNPEYDENGSMINPSLRFVKIDRNVTDDWHKDNWSSIENDVQSDSNIFITPDNMPAKIQYVNKVTGERVNVEW